MKIKLNINRHCIETAARLKNEHLIRAALKAPDAEIEAGITALTWLLKHADFLILRTVINRLEPVPEQAVLEWKSDDPAGMMIRAGETVVKPVMKD